MLVKTVMGDPSLFMDTFEPIRYLGLCCGASLQFLESLADQGRSFDQVFLCDKDTTTRSVAQLELQRIAQPLPDQFTHALMEDIFTGRIFT